ncbi:MAG: hypothetical protein Kow0040_20660 [Thermogutta sp.]
MTRPTQHALRRRADRIGPGWTLCALAVLWAFVSGCTLPPSNIDPSGQRILVPQGGEPVGPYVEVPGRIGPGDCSEFAVTPIETAASVGTEVILVASVRGQDEYMLTNKRVEWTLAESGVGYFVDFNRAGIMDYLVGDFTRPRKVTDRFVITSTTRDYLRLTRGTVTPTDDVLIRPGQAWVSVTSAVEGTSLVNVYVPCVYGWDRRIQTATIHWVDAQWTLPAPAIVPAGSRHKLVTTVTRQRDGTPCSGWKVRYEILDGASAVFAADNSATAEVAVDSAGQAAAEILQTQPSAGVTRIAVQIVRPGDAPGASGRQLTVGRGMVIVTWSGAQLNVRVSGPGTSAPGAQSFRIEVNNSGSLPADAVSLSVTLPPGVSYRSGNPAPSVSGASLSWQVGRLNGGETRYFELGVDIAAAGSYSICAAAQGSGGVTAQNCAAVTVGAPQLAIQIRGPDQAVVGQDVNFIIDITNRGQAAVSGLLVRDTFDAGLRHSVSQGAVERDFPGAILPGETKSIGVTFRVIQPGRWCHTVQVTGPGGIAASQQACLEASAAPGAATTPGGGATTPGGSLTGPGAGTGAGGPAPTPAAGAPSAPYGGTTTPAPLGGTGSAVAPPSTPAPPAGSPGMALPPAPTGTGTTITPPPTAPPALGSGTSGNGAGKSPSGLPQPPFGAGTGGPTAGSPPSSGSGAAASSGLGPGTTPAASPVELRVTGPQRMELGGLGVFTMEVTNRGTTALSQVRLVCDFDVAFEPVRASAGQQVEGESIVWSLAEVTPGQTVRRQVELKAVASAANACCRAQLTDRTGQLAQSSACVAVQPAAPGAATIRERPTAPKLSLRIIDRHEPIAQGKNKVVTLRIANEGNQAARNVLLTVQLPGELKWNPEGTAGPTAAEPTADAGRVRFSPLTELPPGETRDYNVSLTTLATGEAEIRAELSADELSEPITALRKTTIIRP